MYSGYESFINICIANIFFHIITLLNSRILYSQSQEKTLYLIIKYNFCRFSVIPA